MINFQQLILERTIKFILIPILIVVFVGCENSEKPKKFAAKVGNSVLSEEQVANDLLSDRYKNKYREEFIRNWIDDEVLFQEAVEEDLIKDSTYISLIEDSKKELAGALLIQKFFEENPIALTQNDLLNYYNEHKEEFKFANDVYVYNKISFSDEEEAILFRNTLIESDWNKALNAFSGDKSIKNVITEKFAYDYEITPQVAYKILENLNNYEVSIIYQPEPQRYNIVQLVKKINAGNTADYRFVKNLVKDRYINLQRKIQLHKYLDELYSKYDVVINRNL